MAVKRKISKSEFEALSDDKKEFYIENKDRKGEYILDLGDDADNPLKAANDRLKQEKDELTDKVNTLTTDLDAEKKKKQPADGSVTKDDHEAMKASYEKKLTDKDRSHGEVVGKKDAFIKKSLVKDKANALATEISKAPKLLSRIIEDRLSVDMTGDEPKTVVLDSDGKPSAFTLDDLKQELVANKDYADIIIGTKATGGSAHSSPGGGSALPSDKPVNLSSLGGADLVAHMKATNPDLAKGT